ncbi:hypothetical protein MEN24_11265, partial [Dolichospermum sp. ST_sed10]|nr:hypothetical protein [Dolichospermum sp. ST_sed10]
MAWLPTEGSDTSGLFDFSCKFSPFRAGLLTSIIPLKNLENPLYIFSREIKNPDVLPLTPIFSDALIPSNVPRTTQKGFR